jgi:hypothetical protein
MIYITTATTTPVADRGNGILIQNNGALTGTITVKDGDTTKAIITNPAVGNQFRYYGFTGAISLITSASSDITVSILNTTR